MNEEALRLECLRLATPGAQIGAPQAAAAIVERARTYAKFVFGGEKPSQDKAQATAPMDTESW
jgi:hypothetical protein